MSAEIYRQMAAEEAIGDACEFLQIERTEYYNLALQWTELGPQLWQQSTPETFYTNWTGDAGRANLCANIIDQFSRQTVWAVLCQCLPQREDWVYLDYGCGSGVVSFPFLPQCDTAVLVDVPNLAQDYVRWRLGKHGHQHAAVLTPDEAEQIPAGTFTCIACVDVLEHLPNPTEVFGKLDQMLRVGGLLLFRSPWAREDEDFSEHLPEATADWHKPGGGNQHLQVRYEQLLGMDFGGLYTKQRDAVEL